ncbi:hypothetical protein [Steroidobacter sp.]|uniref:hypothetical protein n=1 Tax=Steroidobacter sp. TaxID=1978227 RepID=UPI001A5397AF|nr:hypothetical protein [Steroidobacter sp.]MBL8264957.1 hypothetical protein [Steroidobacter sp.]
MKSLYFVKGHCGWDVLSLLLAEQIPFDEQLTTALAVLDPPFSGGLEVGLLSAMARRNDLRLRITDSTTRQWVSMCGGMTQVIGKALIETQLGTRLGVDVSSPIIDVRLITDSCTIPIHIEAANGQATRVTTTMDSYVDLTYGLGVSDVSVQGVPAISAGEYLVIDVAELEAHHPGLDFTRRDPGPHLAVVTAILEQHRQQHGDSLYSNAMLYDAHPNGAGNFRIFPRFLDATAAALPYEFQCGTGTIALTVALAHAGKLAPYASNGSFVLEWGNPLVTPDPYGIRTSHVSVTLQGQRVTSASFSHSVVEISIEGSLRLIR